MGNSYGRNVLGTVGKSIQLSADGKPEMKSGGVTIDWSLVVAHSGDDLVIEDGITIIDGEKYLRYGQPVSRVGVAEVQTLDLSPGSDPTGGTWDITDIYGVPILEIPYNASAAALQALIRAALSAHAGSEKLTVSLASFVYTITFPTEFGNVATITVDGAGMTTATAITVATSTAGVANAGKFGPAYTNATDGRQTLTRGGVYLVNETVKESDLHSDHPPVLEGGKVWKARIVTVSPNPTLANLIAVLPRLTFADF